MRQRATSMNIAEGCFAPQAPLTACFVQCGAIFLRTERKTERRETTFLENEKESLDKKRPNSCGFGTESTSVRVSRYVKTLHRKADSLTAVQAASVAQTS